MGKGCGGGVLVCVCELQDSPQQYARQQLVHVAGGAHAEGAKAAKRRGGRRRQQQKRQLK
jgi:hypothetical protein